jgi:two-component system response regulator
MTDGPILLVEDNPNDEELTLRTLKKFSIANDISVVRDGEDALAHLFPEHGAGPTFPSVILLDLKLPKVDGLEVLRRVREHESTRLIPVVIFTSSAQEEDVIAGYRFGANAYVRKPVEFADFADAVRTLGLFWFLLNEPPVAHPEPGPMRPGPMQPGT